VPRSPETLAAPGDAAPGGGSAAPPRGRAATALLALLGALTTFGPLSLDMYLPAFPELAAGLGTTHSQVQLTLTACVVGLAAGQLFGGPLSDRWGRRRPAVVGALAYLVASLLCAVAPSAAALTGLRLLQGLAGGIGVVVARAVVRDLYSGVEAARYFSRLTLVFGVAPIVAPALGSLVLTVTSWRGVFVVLAAIGGLLALAAARWLPETLPRARRSTGGVRDTLRTLRALGTDRRYVGYALTQGLAFSGLLTYLAGSPFLLQEVFGLSHGAYSAAFAANAVALVLASQLNLRLLRRYGSRRLLAAALLAGAASAAALLGAVLAGSLPAVLVALFLYLGSLGAVLPNSTALALDRHPHRAGTAAAGIGAVGALTGTLLTPLAGLGDGGNGLSMALVVLAGAVLAPVALRALAREPAAPRTG